MSHALLDRALYLPREWMDDRERCRHAGIPDEVQFATKPALARGMIERVIAQGIPFVWVTGDTIYGGDRNLRLWLEEQQLPFVLAVAKDEPLWSEFRQVRADELAKTIPEEGRAGNALGAVTGRKALGCTIGHSSCRYHVICNWPASSTPC